VNRVGKIATLASVAALAACAPGSLAPTAPDAPRVATGGPSSGGRPLAASGPAATSGTTSGAAPFDPRLLPAEAKAALARVEASPSSAPAAAKAALALGELPKRADLWSSAGAEEIAHGASLPFSVVTDHAGIFWSQSNGNVFARDKRGGAARLLTPASQDEPIYFLAQDDDALYYARVLGIYRLPKRGGVPQALMVAAQPAGGDAEQLRPAIAVDGRYVYFSAQRPEGGVYLGRVGIDGRGRQVLAPVVGDVQAIAVDDDQLYWTSHETVRVGERQAHRCFVERMSKAGGPAVRLADRGGFFGNSALALTKTDVLWADGGPEGKIAAVAKAGGEPRVLARSARGIEPLLATDGRTLFWAEGYSRGLDGEQWGFVMSAPLAGLSAARAVTGQPKHVGGLAADASGVYFGEGLSSATGNHIWRVRRRS
jgi:hypothetical protein